MKNVAFLLPTGANIASLETARQASWWPTNTWRRKDVRPDSAMRTLAVTREVRLDDGRITVRPMPCWTRPALLTSALRRPCWVRCRTWC